MEHKQRFFIYDRKEMAVLLLLGVMVAIFAFTLGVHLGKRVGPKGALSSPHDAETVSTVPDKIPNRQELNEQSKGAQQAADETLNQTLQEEVEKTGIKMDNPRQVQLPDKPVSANGAATTDGANSHEAASALPPPSPVSAASHDTHEAPAPVKRTEPERQAPAAHGESSESAIDVPALRRPAPAGKFTLQIGSFPALAEARDQAESLEALGLKPFLRPAEVKGKRWYRIYVGGYPSREVAEKTGARYLGNHMIEAYVVSKMIDR